MHRYRAGKIKREHTIIPGVLPLLEQVAAHPRVSAVIPGPIYPKSAATRTHLSYQYLTESGFKLLARNTNAVQEVFVVTAHPDQVRDDLAADGLLDMEPSQAPSSPSAETASEARRSGGRPSGGHPSEGRNKERKNPKAPPRAGANRGAAAAGKTQSGSTPRYVGHPAPESLYLHSLQSGEFNASLGGRLSPQLRRRLRQAAQDAPERDA